MAPSPDRWFGAESERRRKPSLRLFSPDWRCDIGRVRASICFHQCFLEKGIRELTLNFLFSAPEVFSRPALAQRDRAVVEPESLFASGNIDSLNTLRRLMCSSQTQTTADRQAFLPGHWPADSAASDALVLQELRRQQPVLAEQSFAGLPLARQKELVLVLPAEQRLDLLLLAPDCTELVRSLPAQEFDRTVRALGKWETQEIVEVASGEQLNYTLDLDCWEGERLDSRSFMDWLRLLMDCDDDHVFRLLTSINADLLALALKKHVRFSRDIMVSDTYYCDPEWVKGSNATVQELLERLYALDPGLWIRLLGWVRMRSKATIEADAIQGREARLHGHGFPAPSLAITIYYPVDFDVPGLIAAWREMDFAPDESFEETRVVEHTRSALFFEQVLEAILRMPSGGPLQRSRIDAQLVDIANKVMVADDVDVDDFRRQKEAVDKVRRWTNIGLEVAAGNSLSNGVRLVAEENFEHFFRLAAMFFDALGSAVVELEKLEHKMGGKLSISHFAPAYFALAEPEPHLPASAHGSSGRAIATLSEYRYAWNLLWRLQAYLQEHSSCNRRPQARSQAR